MQTKAEARGGKWKGRKGGIRGKERERREEGKGQGKGKKGSVRIRDGEDGGKE